MEDRVKLTFHTERPFTGRIFVKGMIDNEKCVNSYASNSKQTFDYQLINGQCNMRRSRKVGVVVVLVCCLCAGELPEELTRRLGHARLRSF